MGRGDTVKEYFFQPFVYRLKMRESEQAEISKKFFRYYDALVEKPTAPVEWFSELETSFFYDGKNRNFDELDLGQTFKPAFDFCLSELGILGKKYQIQSWFNAYSENQFQEVHNHFPNHFSAVYFLQFDKTIHSPLIFENPQPDLIKAFYGQLQSQIHEGVFKDFKAIYPDQGELIFFPSHQKHAVPKQKKTDRKRITIAFNLRLE